MKKSLIFFALCLFLSSCSSDDEHRKNPYLIDLNFAVDLNLDLPQYNDLKFDGSHISLPNYGIKGIVIYKMSDDQYFAYELTDPNHPTSGCSRLELDGNEAFCNCDDGNRYSIIFGQPLSGDLEYGLKPYQVIRRGNVLEISN